MVTRLCKGGDVLAVAHCISGKGRRFLIAVTTVVIQHIFCVRQRNILIVCMIGNAVRSTLPYGLVNNIALRLRLRAANTRTHRVLCHLLPAGKGLVAIGKAGHTVAKHGIIGTRLTAAARISHRITALKPVAVGHGIFCYKALRHIVNMNDVLGGVAACIAGHCAHNAALILVDIHLTRKAIVLVFTGLRSTFKAAERGVIRQRAKADVLQRGGKGFFCPGFIIHMILYHNRVLLYCVGDAKATLLCFGVPLRYIGILFAHAPGNGAAVCRLAGHAADGFLPAAVRGRHCGVQRIVCLPRRCFTYGVVQRQGQAARAATGGVVVVHPVFNKRQAAAATVGVGNRHGCAACCLLAAGIVRLPAARHLLHGVHVFHAAGVGG